MYRHPDPIVPSAISAHWYDEHATAVGQSSIRALLPLALAPGETMLRSFPIAVPPTTGDFRLVLTLPTAPDRTVVDTVVHVRPPSAPVSTTPTVPMRHGRFGEGR